MNELPFRFDSIPWRRVIPWLHLTRAFWIAVDLRKLVLAATGLLLISAGSLVCDQLPFGQGGRGESAFHKGEEARWPWEWSLGFQVQGGIDDFPARSTLSEFRGILEHPGQTVFCALGNWQIVLHPVRAIADPAIRLFRGQSTRADIADAVTRLLWALMVWSVFGGAIARIAAVQFARDQQIGIRRALGFALRRFFGYLSAPLLPLAGVAVLWFLCVIAGWLGRIPEPVGDTLVGILWGVELILGLMMAVVLLGLAIGWPLMFATIGVEGTDGFDGLSRMYNYVYERPLYYLWQIGLVLVYGSGAIFFVSLMAQMLVYLAVWGVSWGGDFPGTINRIADSPTIVVEGVMRTVTDPQTTEPSETVGAKLAQGWMSALATLVMGFVYSFFWTAATIVYFTLRRSVDANDFDEVYLDEEQEADELLPLVGLAATGPQPAPSAEPQPTPPPVVDLMP